MKIVTKRIKLNEGEISRLKITNRILAFPMKVVSKRIRNKPVFLGFFEKPEYVVGFKPLLGLDCNSVEICLSSSEYNLLEKEDIVEVDLYRLDEWKCCFVGMKILKGEEAVKELFAHQILAIKHGFSRERDLLIA